MRFARFVKNVHIINVCKKREIFSINRFPFTGHKHFGCRNMAAKPPNVLVYTGNDCSVKFRKIEKNLGKCLKSDKYIIYHLLPFEIKDCHPWIENSLLLVVAADGIDDFVAGAFQTYFKNHGSILVECSQFNSSFLSYKCDNVLSEEGLVQATYVDIGEIYLFRGKYLYSSDDEVICWDKNNKPLIWKALNQGNTLIFSEAYLSSDNEDSCNLMSDKKEECLVVLKHLLKKEFNLEVSSEDSTVPQPSSGFFLSDIERDIVTNIKDMKIDNSQNSVFFECVLKYLDQQIKTPIYYYDKNISDSFTFNQNLYFSNLQSDVYGHSVTYFPVITSTMEAAKQLSCHDGLVVVAGKQISGKGRGTNKWISPDGAAMFTLNLTVSLTSRLGKCLSLMQHIAALAVVHGIRSQKMYKDLELRIKWPNDIYHDKVKIGGLIVTSEIMKDCAKIYVGWGINVSNSNPTSCLNDIIDNFNCNNSSSLPHLQVEEVIAFTLSQMEFFVKDFMSNGPGNFFDLYYSYWMHGNKRVYLTNLNQEGTVVGLDEFGFLKIETDDGKTLVFQPDGNRFDIMKNLIHSY